MQPTQKIETWAIVEIMGQKKLAGHVTTETFASNSMLRVDVPETKTNQAFSQYYGLGSIYCLTPCDEQTARKMAESLSVKPPITWEMSREIDIKVAQEIRNQLPAPAAPLETAEKSNYEDGEW